MNKIRTFPIILIFIGIMLILDNFNIITNLWFKLWPVFLIIIGVVSIINSIYIK